MSLDFFLEIILYRVEDRGWVPNDSENNSYVLYLFRDFPWTYLTCIEK